MTVKEISHYLNSDAPRRGREQNLDPEDLYGGSKIIDEHRSISIHFLSKPINHHSSCYRVRCEVIAMLKKIVNENILIENATFFVQGSYATGEITAFSDVDVGVIISGPEISVDSMKILRGVVRRILTYIYSLDPLMHHGVDVILAKNLHGYDESVLPVETLRNAVVLNGSGLIDVMVDYELSVKNATEKLLSQCNAIINYREKKINLSLYKLKGLISVVLLIPVLLLQADVGEFLYKRDAIKRARELYSRKMPFIAVDLATQIRENWLVPCYVGKIRGCVASIEPLFPCLQNAQRVAGSTAFFPEREARVFIKEAKKFSNSVRNHILG